MKLERRDVFQQLGNLFYSVTTEQHIKPLEVGKLKLLIGKDWLHRSSAENGLVVSDEMHLILMTMDSLQANEISSRDAFNEFVRFYNLHPEVFTQDMKQHILATAVYITNVFKADNPSGNVSLTALKNLFKVARVRV